MNYENILLSSIGKTNRLQNKLMTPFNSFQFSIYEIAIFVNIIEIVI